MLEKTFLALGFTGVILLIVGLFILGPWLTILAVNQLFGIAIQLNFWNWLSTLWLLIIISSNKKS